MNALPHDSHAAPSPAPAAGAVACPVCTGADCPHYMTFEGMELYSCAGCGTIFLFPLPEPEAAAAFYQDSYEGASTGYFAKVDKKMKRSRGRIRYMSRFVPSGSFLDIGSNGGFMVEAARERGYAASGVEIDGTSVAYAREHYPENEFFHDTVEALAAAGDRQFDLAYCSEVIEHVPDVRGFVAAIAALIRPGGVLFITTPDISHWRRPRDVVSWDAFSPPSHCIYFNPASLKGLLEEFGFRILRRRPAMKPGMKLVCERV